MPNLNSGLGWFRYRPAPKHASTGDLAAAASFLDDTRRVEARYETLFRYFVDGFLAAATPDFERAQYRGMGSSHGYRVAGVEGFARTAPLFAAWIAGGRSGVIEDCRAAAAPTWRRFWCPASPLGPIRTIRATGASHAISPRCWSRLPTSP